MGVVVVSRRPTGLGVLDDDLALDGVPRVWASWMTTSPWKGPMYHWLVVPCARAGVTPVSAHATAATMSSPCVERILLCTERRYYCQ